MQLDCLNVKALFGRSTAYEMMGYSDTASAHCSFCTPLLCRRGQACIIGGAAQQNHVLMATRSATEFDLAIKDMRAASEIEPKHLKKYRTMAAEKKKQKQTEVSRSAGTLFAIACSSRSWSDQLLFFVRRARPSGDGLAVARSTRMARCRRLPQRRPRRRRRGRRVRTTRWRRLRRT